jgi:Crinkler effector protein N-terminal domain
MLDSPVPSQDGSHKLNCLIEGESIVFTVPVGRDWNISNFKKAIQSKRELDTLKGVDPHTLELWKVSAIDESRCEMTWLISRPSQPKDSNPIAAKLADTLTERIGFMGDSLSKFADKLDPTDSLFIIFSKQPPSEYIHIIIAKIPATGEWERISAVERCW